MKKAILLLFYCLLFAVHSSYAQKIRFTDTSNMWGVYWVNAASFSSGIDNISAAGSIVKNSYVYTDFKAYYVREDTLQNVVFILKAKDSIERILYDYNLKLGDTFTMINGNTTIDTFFHLVTKVDSVLLNADRKKVWTFKCYYSNVFGATTEPPYTVIEGIGCLRGLFYPMYPFYFEYGEQVVCFTNNNAKPIVNPAIGNFDNTTSCKLSVSSTHIQSQSITIIPNPANESSKLVFPYILQQGRLVVTNTLGQVVMQKEFQQKDKIELGVLPSGGVYFYTIIDNLAGKSYKGRFVYE